eukprot:scaffold15379_cov133-Isochrysis_galbana.AAC.12
MAARLCAVEPAGARPLDGARGTSMTALVGRRGVQRAAPPHAVPSSRVGLVVRGTPSPRRLCFVHGRAWPGAACRAGPRQQWQAILRPPRTSGDPQGGAAPPPDPCGGPAPLSAPSAHATL